MDETLQQTTEIISEVADISQRLDFLGMLFFITIIVIFIGLIIFVLFYRFSTIQARGDATQMSNLFTALSQNTRAFQETLKILQNEQQIYWRQNTANHRQNIEMYKRTLQVSNHVFRSLKQIVSILEAADLLDTKEMQAIKDEKLNI